MNILYIKVLLMVSQFVLIKSESGSLEWLYKIHMQNFLLPCKLFFTLQTSSDHAARFCYVALCWVYVC